MKVAILHFTPEPQARFYFLRMDFSPSKYGTNITREP